MGGGWGGGRGGKEGESGEERVWRGGFDGVIFEYLIAFKENSANSSRGYSDATSHECKTRTARLGPSPRRGIAGAWKE